MLKLQLTHEQKGLSNHDTNISPSKIGSVKSVQFVKRGEGVGGGFKGRSPNKATIWMGEKDWRNIMLPDDYNVEKVHEMVMTDSQGIEPELKFVKSTENPRVWIAQGNLSDLMMVTSSAPSRTFEVKKAFQALDFIGDVGVNDLKYLLNCEIQLPVNHDNDDNRKAIYDLGDQLSKSMGTPVAANITVVGVGHVHGEANQEAQSQGDASHGHGQQQAAPVNQTRVLVPQE